MIETWRAKFSCGNKIGALIMDLAKTFDTINLDLMVSRKILFHLLEAILQTGTRERKLGAFSVTGTKSLPEILRVQY